MVFFRSDKQEEKTVDFVRVRKYDTETYALVKEWKVSSFKGQTICCDSDTMSDWISITWPDNMAVIRYDDNESDFIHLTGTHTALGGGEKDDLYFVSSWSKAFTELCFLVITIRISAPNEKDIPYFYSVAKINPEERKIEL